MKTLHDYSGNEYQTKQALLPWQAQVLSYTASGYGAKIPTAYKALVAGKWRRVYCTQYSNAGSLWCIVNGQRLELY